MAKKSLIVLVVLGVLATGYAGYGIVAAHGASDPQEAGTSYPIVDTGQQLCYDGDGSEIDCPVQGAAFCGQDAQFDGNQPSYIDNGDGTVTDNVTGVMWQQSPDTDGDGDIDAEDKLTYDEAGPYCTNLSLAGYTDWELPDIKTLYSLIDFRGTDPSSPDSTDLVPFIDSDYFDFAYGDTDAGERLIDAQYASSSPYVSNTANDGGRTLFGVNFADGRIKGYGLTMPGPGDVAKTFFVICARENATYGVNDLTDNGDGTITDEATGLMWAQDDSGTGLNWEEALAWVEAQNDANYLGHDDWRLPNVKELQSIVDYSRSPDTTGSAAIDPLFNATAIINEAGDTDYPFYWSNTTHADSDSSGGNGAYVAFGRALGYVNNNWVDVHGAGAQRSDPKSGNPDDYPYGRGPQGDAVRIYNHVRLVRDAGGDEPNTPPTADAGGPYSGEQGSLIALDGSTSSDPDGTVVRHDWDLDNDGQYDDGHGPTATFTASQTGTFTIGLVVYDDDGAQDSDTATVTVIAGDASYTVYLPLIATDQEDVPRHTIEQTLSDEAQRNTIAFDGLAFLTGNLGADSFFPPGKVADFWGFQYLRDNDPTEMGHNTDFLTRASLNMLHVLTPNQRHGLIALAESQVDDINQYAYDRFVLMDAFRRLLDGDLPAGTTGLDQAAVQAYSAYLYRLDGQISYERAQVMGTMIAALTADQRAYLDAMVGQGMLDWPAVDEPPELQGLDHDVKVAVMTYAGDMFSWYAGSVDDDVYFCPERQGTYFGSFYMKDAPAVGNPGYSIPVTLTAEMGAAFLQILMPEQSSTITGLVEAQKPALYEIVDRREDVASLLRQFMTGGTPDQAAVLDLMERYGELDGEIVYRYATAFTQVGQSLTAEQQAELTAMRTDLLGELAYPDGAYLYSEPIPMPEIPSSDFLFARSD